MRQSVATWPTTPTSGTPLQRGTRTRRRFVDESRLKAVLGRSTKRCSKLRISKMHRISRRTFLKTASASAACVSLWNGVPRLMANPLGLPIGLQLYSVRDILPKDYEGTLRQLSALGYREVEAAGFFGHSPADVKLAMDHAGLNCLSAHYPLRDLLPKLDEIIQFGKDLGLKYIVCASPMLKDPSRVKDPASRAARESMTLEDWRWNAQQFNRIGEKVNAAGMHFAYHNHTPEFRSENGVLFYDELLKA